MYDDNYATGSDELQAVVGERNISARTPPPPGWTPGVCIDTYIKRNVGTRFGERDFIYFYWETDYVDPDNDDGRGILVWERYNFTLNEKSNLFKAVSGWMGRSPEKGQRIVFERFIGMPAYLLIQIDGSNDPSDPYVNVSNIAPLPPNIVAPQPSGKWLRLKDRKAAEDGPQSQQPPASVKSRPATTSAPNPQATNTQGPSYDEGQMPEPALKSRTASPAAPPPQQTEAPAPQAKSNPEPQPAAPAPQESTRTPLPQTQHAPATNQGGQELAFDPDDELPF